MPRYEISVATPAEIGAFYERISDNFVLRVDGEAVAMGAVSTQGDRRWAMLNVSEGVKDHGVRVVRAARRFLEDRNETTYVVCGFPEAGRLLSVLGFAPTDEINAENKRVWKWRCRGHKRERR